MWRIPVRVFRLSRHLVRGVSLSRRPLEPDARRHFTQSWLSELIQILALRVHIRGEALPPGGGSLWLPNHVSWLDIPLIGSIQPDTVFLSKSEVGQWPVIGRLARAAGTLFMARGAGADAARQTLAEGLSAGRNVVVFAEGTTSDGSDVRRLHARLIQPALDTQAIIQPIALRFCTPAGDLDRRAAFIGEDHLIGSLWRVLRAKELHAHVHFLEPIHPYDALGNPVSRDQVARLAEQRIRAAIQPATGDIFLNRQSASSSILPS